MHPGRILYLALADARGHLMRAHLLRRSLAAAASMEVDVVTTSREGVRFLQHLGTPARSLSEHFRVEFNARHDMSRSRTDRRVLRYLLLPWRGLADLRRLMALARGADLVVNDSLHPALLAAPAVGFPVPVVQVHGENLWRAMEDNFEGRAPHWLSRHYRAALRSLRDLSFARIVHTLGGSQGPTSPAPRTYVLPPIVARPARTRAQVRRELGVPDGVPLAAVYLNPHFREPSIAEALERALGLSGFHRHLVGEGYAGRAGWVGTDARFGDVVHAADLFVSGAGMGALELARSSGTPLLVLLGDQPEQERNVADAGARCPALRLRAVALGGPGLDGAIAEAADVLVSSPAAATRGATVSPEATETAWTRAFVELVATARSHAGARSRRLRAGARPLLGEGAP